MEYYFPDAFLIHVRGFSKFQPTVIFAHKDWVPSHPKDWVPSHPKDWVPSHPEDWVPSHPKDDS